MAEVKNLNPNTPLAIAQRTPWEKLTKCIVIYETGDGPETQIALDISQMSRKDLAHFAMELQSFVIGSSMDGFEDIEV